MDKTERDGFLRDLGIPEYSAEEREWLEKETARHWQEFVDFLRAESLSRAEVMTLTGWSSSEIDQKVQQRTLLSWLDREHTPPVRYFPVAQFDGSEVIHWLPGVLQRITGVRSDSYQILGFLLLPLSEYGGRCRLQLVEDDLSWLPMVEGQAAGLGII